MKQDIQKQKEVLRKAIAEGFTVGINWYVSNRNQRDLPPLWLKNFSFILDKPSTETMVGWLSDYENWKKVHLELINVPLLGMLDNVAPALVVFDVENYPSMQSIPHFSDFKQAEAHFLNYIQKNPNPHHYIDFIDWTIYVPKDRVLK